MIAQAINMALTYTHFFTGVNPCFQRLIQIHSKPITMAAQAIVWMSHIFSTGIHTFIFDQRFPPVKIPINSEKNAINQIIPILIYAIIESIAIMRMSVVTFILKASPTIIPTTRISGYLLIKLFLIMYHSNQNPLTLTIISVGSSFMSLAC